MLQKITNVSDIELTLEIKTLDRTKGNRYCTLQPDEDTSIEEQYVSDQIRTLAKKKITRSPLVTIEFDGTPAGTVPTGDDATNPGVDAVAMLAANDQFEAEKAGAANPPLSESETEADSHECFECDREFDTERGLSVHMRTHE